MQTQTIKYIVSMLMFITCTGKNIETKSNEIPKIDEPETYSKQPRIKSCKEKKTEMLNKCKPDCESNPSLMGEKFDLCLNDCSVKNFGEKLSLCSK